MSSAIGYYGPGGDPETIIVLVVILLIAAWLREQLGQLADSVRDQLSASSDDRPPAGHPAPELWCKYSDLDSNMSEAEFKRRLEAHLDPGESAILETVDDVDGIGRERRFNLAAEYGTLEALAAADPDEVAEQVNRVGEVYAEKAVRAAVEATDANQHRTE